MDLISYFNIHLEQHNPPIFVADMKTDKILYLNSTMRELLGERQDVIGKEFYKVITNRIEKEITMESKVWDMEHMAEAEIFCQDLNMRFHVQHIPFEFSGVMYNMCKYIPMNTTDSSKISFNEAMTRCILIIKSGSKNIVTDLLKLLCKYYDAEKAYYCKINQAKMELNCDTMWHENSNENDNSEFDLLRDPEKLESWLRIRNEVGFIEVDNRFQETSPDCSVLKVLKEFDLENIVQSVVESEQKEITALIGVTNRKEVKLEYRFLRIITKLIEHADDVSMMQDIFEKVSRIDILTGFYRNASYLEKFEDYRKHLPKTMGVILANINGLKQINAEYGYAQGDTTIKRCAEVLKAHFKIDFYRISGDEFVGFFENIGQNEFEELVLALRKSMRERKDDLFALGRVWRQGSYRMSKLMDDVRTSMYINKQDYYSYANKSIDEIED